jgi:hypothetical protein
MDRFLDHRTFRQSLVDDLRRQTFGPSEVDDEQQKGEVLPLSPLQLYSTGVLFPQKLRQESLEDSKPSGSEESLASDVIEPQASSDGQQVPDMSAPVGGDDETAEQEPLNLANEFSPSAVGLSFRVRESAEISVDVSFGTYVRGSKTEPHPRAGQTGLDGRPFSTTRTVPEFARTHRRHSISISIPAVAGALPAIPVDGSGGGLTIRVMVRPRLDNSLVVSVMAVNENAASGSVAPDVQDVFFQVSMQVTHRENKPIFLPVDRDVGGASDEELASLELLYRHRRAFALGHGAAGDWNRDEGLSEEGATNRVLISSIPLYELKPIRPRQSPFGESGLNLSMKFLSTGDESDNSDEAIRVTLKSMLADYELWIGDIEHRSRELGGALRKTAENHAAHCRACHQRVSKGIDVLAEDKTAMLAFRMMNRAMLVQQFHTSILKRRDFGSEFPKIAEDYGDLGKGKGQWYPFQLAFILMNIKSIVDPGSDERKLVDLIWFPTGGGKTEAYLGLSAFTICYERMIGRAVGTTVLMRYTLRLLTAQQFQRASALIAALEKMRRDKWLGVKLGPTEISIGLWVGKGLSPNKRADARKQLKDLRDDRYAKNPFQTLECPWCRVDLTSRAKLGYAEVRCPDSREKTVRTICPDDACEFSAARGGLPIMVIDDDIYDSPPTLLIGTVDKFAQIAWDRRVGRLFGIGVDTSPPTLVIQDELHLISGPLGTIVGLYETAIDRLCSRDGHVHKIIASTATIRRAQDQCWNLYARKTFEFPPQGIRAGDSYFAFEDGASPGRLYVGYMGTAVKSHQTALVRVCSPLLQSVCEQIDEGDDRKREIVDPYGTLVWYFNSLRELGHAATLCNGDIPEHILGLCARLGLDQERRRYVREVVELTSRRTADEIPSILQQLEVPWRMRPKGQQPIDVLLATNMIAVGVDVPRLGLIIMSGQPKTTSEYIQATSRVGRSHPGLVVAVYAQTKSRDRSHYERFIAYHQSLYRFVEPTSVTPFSPQARDRGMRGVLIALARLMSDVETPDKLPALEKRVAEEVHYILDRIEAIDPDEVEEAELEFRGWLADWKKILPQEYGKMGGKPDTTTLVFPFGSVRDPLYQRDAWPMMTSMRNVDGTSAAMVLNSYDAVDRAEAE